MSFDGTTTPCKPTVKPKYYVPLRKGKNDATEFYLTEELEKRFMRYYPVYPNKNIMEWFGLSFTTMQRFQRSLGLKKNMKVIMRENAKATKKTCEANGYYAILRGKPPSEACIEAIRKKRKEGFNPILQ